MLWLWPFGAQRGRYEECSGLPLIKKTKTKTKLNQRRDNAFRKIESFYNFSRVKRKKNSNFNLQIVMERKPFLHRYCLAVCTLRARYMLTSFWKLLCAGLLENMRIFLKGWKIWPQKKSAPCVAIAPISRRLQQTILAKTMMPFWVYTVVRGHRIHPLCGILFCLWNSRTVTWIRKSAEQ